MNCREFDAIVIDFVRDPMAEARAQALSHVESCAFCAARLAQERVLRAHLQLVAEDFATQDAPAYIEANLLAALHEQAERKPGASPLVAIARWWSWQFAAAAVAVLLLIALAVTWRSDKEPKQEAQQMPTFPQVTAPPTAKANETVAIPNAPPRAPVTTHRVPPRRSPRPPLPAAPEEVAAPFYSLVEDAQMAPLESVRIVRIEVPPASLVKLGVPLTETTLTQPMQADLLVGQDGLARAIRFVPNSQLTQTQE